MKTFRKKLQGGLDVDVSVSRFKREHELLIKVEAEGLSEEATMLVGAESAEDLERDINVKVEEMAESLRIKVRSKSLIDGYLGIEE